jgi:hypothetical protein
MRLLGYSISSSIGFMSVWNAQKDFKLPPCKIRDAREELPKFCNQLVAQATRVLEVLPEKGVLSCHAVQQDVPTTVLVLGTETANRIGNRLRGELDEQL